MKIHHLLLIPALLLPTLAPAAAKGIVFEDRNADGKRTEGEPGIAGVPVSDGRDIVLTDAEGRYQLATEGEAVLFVIKPANYALPLSRESIPQFYYVHRPAGSPSFRYEGIAPTGPLPESIDFPLLPQPFRENFTVLLMADPQPRTHIDMDYVRRDILSEIATDGEADFAIILGDILFDDLRMFRPWKQALAHMGFPVLHVIGNHDLNFDAVDDTHSGETYTRHFGPLNYSWNEGKVHFVALDNIRWNGAEKGNYDEAFEPAQMQWLAKDLALVPEDHLVVICTHAPIWFPDRKDPLVKNGELLLATLKDRRAVYAVNGHTHVTTSRVLGAADGWKGTGRFHHHNITTASGSWWSGPTDIRNIPVTDQRDGTPNGYVYLDVRGTDYTPRFRAAGAPANQQMRIYPPGTTYLDGPKAEHLLVNVFDGMADAEVTVSINGGEPTPMTFAPQLDPLARQYFGGAVKAGATSVRPVPSQHIWEAPVDMKSNQIQRVTVTYRDSLGREFKSTEILLHR